MKSTLKNTVKKILGTEKEPVVLVDNVFNIFDKYLKGKKFETMLDVGCGDADPESSGGSLTLKMAGYFDIANKNCLWY